MGEGLKRVLKQCGKLTIISGKDKVVYTQVQDKIKKKITNHPLEKLQDEQFRS